MPTPTCTTCRFWGRRAPGVCGAVDREPQKGQPFMELQISALDDTGLEGELITSPDFGCVLHEAKP